MYERLVAALNAADKRPCSDIECPGSGGCPEMGCLFREAADAIEKLEEQLAGYRKYDNFLAVHGLFDMGEKK